MQLSFSYLAKNFRFLDFVFAFPLIYRKRET
jgi:hypothetical protein